MKMFTYCELSPLDEDDLLKLFEENSSLALDDADDRKQLVRLVSNWLVAGHALHEDTP